MFLKLSTETVIKKQTVDVRKEKNCIHQTSYTGITNYTKLVKDGPTVHQVWTLCVQQNVMLVTFRISVLLLRFLKNIYIRIILRRNTL